MDREEKRLLRELVDLIRLAVEKYLGPDDISVSLSIEGIPMTTINPNYQLTEGDSVQVTIVVTDDVTGDVITPASVTATSTDPNDTVVVDPSFGFLTLTASDALNTDQVLTVTAVSSEGATGIATGEYDVVAATTVDPISVALTFGTESAPSSASSAIPEGYVLNEATGGLDHV